MGEEVEMTAVDESERDDIATFQYRIGRKTLAARLNWKGASDVNVNYKGVYVNTRQPVRVQPSEVETKRPSSRSSSIVGTTSKEAFYN